MRSSSFLILGTVTVSTPVGFINHYPFDFNLQLSAIMTVANCFVDLIDIQGSSVLVCFEDGWDATPQVMAGIITWC